MHIRQRTLLFVALATLSTLFARCQPATDVPANMPKPANDPPLKNVAPFAVGVAVGYNYMRDNAAYQDVVRTEMSSITVENAQKWSGLHPAADRFDFTQADYIVDWARREGKRVHGHNLLWHMYNPAWLGTFQGDSLAWENLMKTHIQTVVRHFKGRVAGWDVVNEAFTDAGKLRNVETDPKNSSIWRQKLGPDYLARAFQYAHAADPDVLLFYNEYGQENHPAKIKATLDMVADFKRRNIPIHGLGAQMHIGMSVAEVNIRSVLEQFAQTGLRVHISELDILVSDWKKDSTLTYTEARQAKQVAKYKFIAEAYREIVPEKQQYGITTWNVGDGDSWIRKQGYTDWPLLFDEKYAKKKTYYGFLDGLK